MQYYKCSCTSGVGVVSGCSRWQLGQEGINRLLASSLERRHRQGLSRSVCTACGLGNQLVHTMLLLILAASSTACKAATPKSGLQKIDRMDGTSIGQIGLMDECSFSPDCKEVPRCQGIQDASCVCNFGRCVIDGNPFFRDSQCNTFQDCACK